MFDAISVSEHTRKPWTVALSFAGQGVLIALAILIPLVKTQALPHGSIIKCFLAPEPPRALPHHESAPQTAVARPVPSEFKRGILQAPANVPKKIVLIEDLAPSADTGEGIGVPGGLGDASGTGNPVIDSVATYRPPPPPPPAVSKPPAQAAAVTRIKVGGLIQEGRLIFGPPPVYPPLAKAARVSGVVRLQAVIAVDGSIMDLHTLSGHPLLVPAAIAAVKQWRFRPTHLNGDPVEVATEIEVRFVLQR